MRTCSSGKCPIHINKPDDSRLRVLMALKFLDKIFSPAIITINLVVIRYFINMR
jgi:hypothetical protein